MVVTATSHNWRSSSSLIVIRELGRLTVFTGEEGGSRTERRPLSPNVPETAQTYIAVAGR